MGNVSSKIFQVGAFRPERSSDGSLHKGWGKQPALPIRDTDGFPYVEFSNKPTLSHVEDNQVIGNAFKTGKRLVGKLYDGSLDTLDKFSGANDFIYFNFQWEEAVISVVMYKGTPTSADLVVGDYFTDVDSNTFILSSVAPTRDINGDESSIYIFLGSAASVSDTGTLNNVTSVGEDLNFTSHSEVKYRHRFTLDSKGRNLRDFTTAEKAALGGHVVGADQKSPFATMAKHINTSYDFVYANMIATSFEINCSAADLFHIKSSVMAPYQNRVQSVIPEDIKMGCEEVSLANAPAHYQSIVRIAPLGETLVEYGITDISIKTEAPVDKLQTTTSGLGLAEPYLEGKYGITADLTIGRHETELFQQYRDENLPMHADITVTRGWDLQQIHMKKVYVNDAGPSDGDIADESLPLEVSWDCENTMFNDTQNSPIIFDTYDSSPYNAMTGRDSSGALA